MESTDKNILKELKEIKSDREMKDIVDKIIDLQRQKLTPDREGMIKALFNAQMLAAPEIVQTTIQSTGAVYSNVY